MENIEEMIGFYVWAIVQYLLYVGGMSPIGRRVYVTSEIKCLRSLIQ